MAKEKMNAAQIAAMVFGLVALCLAAIAVWQPFAQTRYTEAVLLSGAYENFAVPYVFALVGLILVGALCVWLERKSRGILHALTGLAFLAYWVVCEYRMRMDILEYVFGGYAGAYYCLLAAAFLMLGAGLLLAGAERKMMPTGLLVLTVFALQMTAFMTFMPFGEEHAVDGRWGQYALVGWMRCVILAICLFEAGVVLARVMRKDILLLLGGVVILAMAIGSFLNEYYDVANARLGFYGFVIGGLLLLLVGILLPGRLKMHSLQPEAGRE